MAAGLAACLVSIIRFGEADALGNDARVKGAHFATLSIHLLLDHKPSCYVNRSEGLVLELRTRHEHQTCGCSSSGDWAGGACLAERDGGGARRVVYVLCVGFRVEGPVLSVEA